MMLGEFIGLYPDLGLAVEHLGSRVIGEEPRVLEWTRGQMTPEVCRAVIDKVKDEDAKARAAGRALPSSGAMGEVANEARVLLKEFERAARYGGSQCRLR